MARRAARVDANHLEICHTLRRLGAHVVSLASVGDGCPDIAISLLGRWHMAEIKNGKRHWKLTPDQVSFLIASRAPILLFQSPADAELWVQEERRNSSGIHENTRLESLKQPLG